MHLSRQAQLLVRSRLTSCRHLGLFDLFFNLAEFLAGVRRLRLLLWIWVELLAQVLSRASCQFFFGLVLNRACMVDSRARG